LVQASIISIWSTYSCMRTYTCVALLVSPQRWVYQDNMPLFKAISHSLFVFSTDEARDSGQIFMRLSHYSTYMSPHNRIEHRRTPTRQRWHICSSIWRLAYTWLGIDKTKAILFINTLSVYIRRGDEVVMTGIRQYKSSHIIHRDEHSTRRYDDHCAQLNRRFSTDSFYRCN
jgi:hypothetical protein